jgi:HEAT repeat protein
LTHSDPTIRRNAARSLGRIGEPAASAIAQIVSQLNDPDASVRSHAAEALGALHAAEAIPNLVQALADSEAVVRQQAVRALGEMKDKAKPILSQVQAAKSDEDPEVRKAATRAERLIDPSLAGKVEKKKE